ncbi:hypothetical protein Bhyg_17819, partial [Pseudolycoriella hygida]
YNYFFATVKFFSAYSLRKLFFLIIKLPKTEYKCEPGKDGDTACTWQCAYYQNYFGVGVCGVDSFCYCKLKVNVNPNISQEMAIDICGLDSDRDSICNAKCLTIPIFKAGYCGVDSKCYCLRK